MKTKQESKKRTKLKKKHEVLDKADKIQEKIKVKASKKIIRLYGNTLTFKVVDRQEAFKDKVKQITLVPDRIGSAMASDIDAFFARSYIIARREIPRNAIFMIHASCVGVAIDKHGDNYKFNVTTRKFSSEELNKFFDDLMDKVYKQIQSGERILLSQLKFQYNFAIIPSGAGCGTKCREIESIMNKKSVIPIVNDDNNCFWYAMAVLFNSTTKQIKDSRNTNLRMRIAKEICNKSKCTWDNEVSFLQIPLVEETYNCNIYVIDENNIPMLGTTISLLLNCLMYKSDNKNTQHYFLLYNENQKHYNCITDIKKFMGVREFCYKCLTGFTHKDKYENHHCDTTIIKKKTNDKRHEGKMLKDISHYLTRKFTKGSSEELALGKNVDHIKHPRYIIYDFETDTHTDIHKPNHVEIDILEIDEGMTHTYNNCLVGSFNFNGYGCENAFCDWLFTENNRDSTVIAHNGAGYDNKFILQYCLNKGLIPSAFIRQGSRITYMSFKNYHIRFIDSLHFFLQPLKKLSSTYNIDTLKGYFPHHFNKPENQNYVGKIPDEKEYGVKNMMVDDYEKERLIILLS